MANKNLLTYGSKVIQSKMNYYSPVAVIPTQVNTTLTSTYCFLAKVNEWNESDDPITPLQDQKSIKSIFKGMFAAKLVKTNDVSPVIERIDWTSGQTYDYYVDDEDMFETDENGFLVKRFYVKNRYDQVFKCLWNNNGESTTVEPFFEPGTYSTNNVFIGADGYKWKYIYTIDIGLKVKFLDNTWMPVPVSQNGLNPLGTAGRGSIDVINVTNGGNTYNTTVTVSITGDGTGAAATANVSSGVVTDITVTSPGKNYTYANVAITSTYGSGAVAFAPSSPVGGHGSDPISELGCSHTMYSIDFNSTEGGKIPVTNEQEFDFHQIGLVVDPTTSQTNPVHANGAIYETCTQVTVAGGSGIYANDETVTQHDTLGNLLFTATVLSFNTSTNVIKLINTEGTITKNLPIIGSTSTTSRTLLDSAAPEFTLFSGYITYIDNRTGVTRTTDGIEQFKFVLGY